MRSQVIAGCCPCEIDVRGWQRGGGATCVTPIAANRSVAAGCDPTWRKGQSGPKFGENGQGSRSNVRFGHPCIGCLVAQGRFDGMMTFRPSWEWDIAAGALILKRGRHDHGPIKLTVCVS
jgi:hypothetical protein